MLTVSYTHLDVYKRQPFTLMKWGLEGVDTWQEWLDKNIKKGDVVGFNGYITSEGLCEEIQNLLADRAESVSYTHLDVYKRQS